MFQYKKYLQYILHEFDQIFDDFVKQDKKFIINNYKTNKDKELLYINKLDFTL